MFNSLIDEVDFDNKNSPHFNRIRFLNPNIASSGSNIRKLSYYDMHRLPSDCTQTSFSADQLVKSIFDTLKHSESDRVDPAYVQEVILRSGIELTDPRIAQFISNASVSALMSRGSDCSSSSSSPKHSTVQLPLMLDLEMFAQAATESLQMLLKIVSNDFCVPQFMKFKESIREIYENVKRECNDGENASYIPQLSEVDPKLWAVSVCTVDGQRCDFGDSDKLFTMQSTSKPLSYALAITQHGPDEVHKFVGYEPSGRKFNLVILNEHNKPHNPLINSGAIAVTSLLKKGSPMSERFTYINKEFSRMAGNANLGFNNAVYLSERSTADRNFSLAYYMREHKCFPPGTDLHETLDLYFQLCSIEINTRNLAAIASTFANGGMNPVTGEKVLSGASVRDTLSVMYSCGMYDYSGQFAFKVGLPAKSGVSGAIMIVVPNLMGIAIFSPPLDSKGNSCKGIKFCQELVRKFVFHNYDSLLHSEAKLDPRKQVNEDRAHQVVRLLFAAQNNDIGELRRCFISHVDFNTTDYDDRTGLHVAACSGAFDAVRFFIEVAHVDPNPIDRWGRTPYIDAKHFGQTHICDYLLAHMKKGELYSPTPNQDTMNNSDLENFKRSPKRQGIKRSDGASVSTLGESFEKGCSLTSLPVSNLIDTTFESE